MHRGQDGLRSSQPILLDSNFWHVRLPHQVVGHGVVRVGVVLIGLVPIFVDDNHRLRRELKDFLGNFHRDQVVVLIQDRDGQTALGEFQTVT